MQDQTCLQDDFLHHLSQENLPVTLFLINGVKLQGHITAFDKETVLLRREGHVQLVYKHALSTVMPVAALLDFP
ncbi:RNA chaperone Hfq [Acetobacteraceae bacterium]|nr:RNA chaperone Hfq [Acetobacteraceae bacterium]